MLQVVHSDVPMGFFERELRKLISAHWDDTMRTICQGSSVQSIADYRYLRGRLDVLSDVEEMIVTVKQMESER